MNHKNYVKEARRVWNALFQLYAILEHTKLISLVDAWSPKGGTTSIRHKGIFEGNSNILYYDCGGS